MISLHGFGGGKDVIVNGCPFTMVDLDGSRSRLHGGFSYRKEGRPKNVPAGRDPRYS